MKLKSVFQMWSQKSCEKAAIHVCLLCPTSAIQNYIGLLLYALADAAPGLSLPWNSVVLDHIALAPSHTWPRILLSVVFSPAFALLHSSGVCMLEFMLIDNNQLTSFFSDLPRYQRGQSSVPCPPVFLPAWDIYPHLWFRRALAFQVTSANPCKTEWHILSNVPLKSQLYFTCHIHFAD